MLFSDMYGALRTRLADPNDTRWSLQEKKDALNFVYRDFCEFTRIARYWVGFTVDGVYSDYYCSDHDVLDVIAVAIGAQRDVKLRHISVEQAMDIYPDWANETGEPYYYLFGDVGYRLASDPGYTQPLLKVLPFPADAAVTDINALAVVIPPDMANDDDTPLVPRTYHDCLVDGAAGRLVINANQQRDLPAAQLWWGNYLDKRNAAKVGASRSFSTAPPTISTSWL